MLRLWPLPAALLILLAGCAGGGSGATYCIQDAGKVWSGAAVPPAATATCPQSQTVREEVRAGDARIEQYELRGWQPEPILSALQKSGFRILTQVPDDGIQYAAVLIRRRGEHDEQLTYVADRMNGGTLVSVTSRSAH